MPPKLVQPILGALCIAAATALALACASTPADEPLREVDALLAAGRPDAALAALESALQNAPDDPELSIRIGRIEQQQGNTADAYVAFRRAAALAPDDVRAVSGLALTADALGFEREAARAYERWSELEEGGVSGGAEGPGTDPW